MDIGNVKDMIEELEKTALGFKDTRYGLLITASEMMDKLQQENGRLRAENETLVNNIVKIGDIAQEQDTYVERLREEVKASEQLCKIYFDIANQFLSENKIREVRDEKIKALEEK